VFVAREQGSYLVPRNEARQDADTRTPANERARIFTAD
jgi:hypothetical protein